MTRRAVLVLALLASAVPIGVHARESALVASDPALVDRLELHMEAIGPALRSRSLEHSALIDEVSQEELLRALAPVSFRPDGEAFVLGVDSTVEYHGGGILGLLFDYWRPGGRPASRMDRFPFRPNRAALALGTLYAGHRRQIFLPEGSRPGLPRMRFFVRNPGIAEVERDAYSFLRLVVLHEPDYANTWQNHLGQTLSADRLLGRAWSHYLEDPSVPTAEEADHSRLHLIEILLAYHHHGAARGSAAQLDPNALKARFLAIELSRPAEEVDDESLGHYGESLGLLAADPHVTWEAEDREAVARWLRSLEGERFADLGAVEARHLAHLLRGLRLLRTHPDVLTPTPTS
jgi:hypothetical protein